MTATLTRSFRLTNLLVALLLGSCAAPISYKKIVVVTPVGDFSKAPLSRSLQELDAAKAESDPIAASGHLFECARLAGNQALVGQPGALALYNQAVGLLVEQLQTAKSLPWGRSIVIGSGSATYTLRGKLEPGASSGERQYVNVASLKFAGVYSQIQATRAGLGAPLVAIFPENKDYLRSYAPPRLHESLTAVLRFDSAKFATLELHDPLEQERISIAGRNPVLAADFSAPVSMFMAIARPDKLGLIRLLNPQKYSYTARITRLQKYDPKRIPVLFVHGLDSTPATWTLMYNSLLNDPVIRDKYQFWVFSYPSGYPYPYSASLLRKELDGIDKKFPDHRKMVIVGHSMGGMISRLMVTESGDQIWRSMFGKSPEKTQVFGASRPILEDAVIFHPRSEIAAAIFIATPHRGSELSNHWLGRMFSRLVHVPTFLADTRNAFASALTADAASLNLDRAPNSIDTLAPNNRFVRAVNRLPIAPGVIYHSIIGDRGKGGNHDKTPPVSSDGVVPYWSSHLVGAASEKIVPSGHSAHENLEAIAEVRRILEQYARQAN